MRAIFKAEIPKLRGRHEAEVGGWNNVTSIEFQGDIIALWFLSREDAIGKSCFHVFFTGEHIPYKPHLEFRKTLIDKPTGLVYHVFEELIN